MDRLHGFPHNKLEFERGVCWGSLCPQDYLPLFSLVISYSLENSNLAV